MNEVSQEPWRGRLRLLSAEQPPARRAGTLTEAERDAIDVWLPQGTVMLAFTRGRPTRDGSPVWVLTARGILVALLTNETREQVRARTEWLPAEHLRRIDLDVDGELAVVRVVSLSRRFVMYGIDRDCAVRFVALSRAAMAAHASPRRPAPQLAEKAR